MLWKRGEIVPEEQFLLFSTMFSTYLYLHASNYIFFLKCGCSKYFFLNSANLICRGTDISKYFRESLRLEITRVDRMFTFTALIWKRFVVIFFCDTELILCVSKYLFRYLVSMKLWTCKRVLRYESDFFNPVSILHKTIAGPYRSVKVADGPITARCRFIKNASWACEQM